MLAPRSPLFGPPRRLLALLLAGTAASAPGLAQSEYPSMSRTIIDEPTFSRDRFMDRIEPRPIFFPPLPPPLDRPVNRPVLPAPVQLTPPVELAAYVGEPFYAPLGSRLAGRSLNPKLRERLDAYRTTRTTLRDELHDELTRVRAADPATRQRALSALAARQAPRLADLEKSAELLRQDLINSDSDWNALRQWRLGDAVGRGDSPREVAQVLRAYAYYQKGLLPAQRGLLREISAELALAGEDIVSATAAQPFFFFSPEPARVELPDDLPAPLAARVADYQTKLSALKKELYDAVDAQESSGLLHPHALRNVAGGQTARLAALEQLAEEIRRGLAELPSFAPPAVRSPLPPVLTARIATLRQNRAARQKETQARIEEIRARAQAADGLVEVNYAFDATGLKFAVQPRRSVGERSSGATRRQLEATSLEMTSVAEEFGRRFAELANETEAIRHAAADTLGDATPAAVEEALAGAVRFTMLSETDAAYRDYRTAVFEPGLLPEQRRLLLGDAVEQLDLPLLRGEFQPVLRGDW